jgi:ERF superfamily protein
MSAANQHIIEKCDHNGFASQLAARIAEPSAPRRAAITVPIQQSPAVSNPTPLSIVQAALASGNVEMYREAVALAKEMDAITARKAFDNAMADAKAKITVIKKNRSVGFDSRKAGAARTEYAYEDLAEIARTIDPILGAHGLSYRFRVSSEVNQPVRVTCVVSHRDGHSEETTLMAGRDESGNKNAIQAIGSTVTYLQRYTLKAALGLAAAHDDDGRSSEQAAEEEPAPASGCITPDQAQQILNALKAKGALLIAFLQHVKQKRIDDIPATQFDACMRAIAGFRRN